MGHFVKNLLISVNEKLNLAMQTVQIQVFGRVQGVYFRASTKQQAESLGICGWVRNEVDGSVQIEATGSKEQLDQLMNWCQKGPDFARVDRMEIKNMELKSFDCFEVIRS